MSDSAAATIGSYYWSPAATTTVTQSWLCTWESLPDLVFWPDMESTYDLPAHEKSIHGRPRGRLKGPKLQLPRAYKPKINYNFYRKGTE